MGWGSLCGLQATEKAHHMAGGLTKMSCCPTQARCHPTGSIGGPFENQSEALGLLSRIEPLEVGEMGDGTVFRMGPETLGSTAAPSVMEHGAMLNSTL